MTYIIFRLLCNLFDLCCINLCKIAKHWDSFLNDCNSVSMTAANVSGGRLCCDDCMRGTIQGTLIYEWKVRTEGSVGSVPSTNGTIWYS